MEAYKSVFEFVFDSQQGAEIKILIEKFGYTGETRRRALGSAPKLKRQNNRHVYGTSLEIYAECLVDGEYAELYTSSAYEYRVRLFKNDAMLWIGFVTPELYSEPDIAPPYDVQIVATDGLGELKNYDFNSEGLQPIYGHLTDMINKSGIGLGYEIVSDLCYVSADGTQSNSSSDIMNVRIDLSHENGETCYDVLQTLLASLNAGITQHNGRWLLFRETDFIRLASQTGLLSYDINGVARNLDVATFGSAASSPWWPVGQLSSVIIPAKKSVGVECPNNYKNNALSKEWATSSNVLYDENEGAYILSGKGSYISQKIEFESQVRYRLGLRVSARNVGSGEQDQNLGVKVKINGFGSGSAGRHDFWLVQASSDRGTGSYVWRGTEGDIAAELAMPSDADTAVDANNVDIILPLTDGHAFVGADDIDIKIFNPSGIYDIYVYGVMLNKYEQLPGYQADVVINNGARETGDTAEVTFAEANQLPAAGDVFMTGIPQIYGGEVIVSWKRGTEAANDYLSTIAEDYARTVAMPLLRYNGVINFPHNATVVPALFYREGTYYFPRIFTYDLLNDEFEAELMSIPAAEVSISSSTITAMASPSEKGPSTSSVSGVGGAVSIPRDKQMSDTSDNAVENRVIKTYVDQTKKDVLDLLASMWYIDESGAITTNKQVRIKNNLIVNGDTASGGVGGGTSVGISGIALNGKTYTDVNGDGIIDLGTITSGLTSVSWTDVQGRPTKLSQFANDLGLGSLAYVNSLSKSDVGLGNVENKSSATIRGEITSANVTTALGYTPYNSANFTKANIKSTLGISDWALASSKPTYTASEVGALSTSGGTIKGVGDTNQHVININTDNNVMSNIRIMMHDSTKGGFGYSTTTGLSGYRYGVFLYNATAAASMGIKDSGTPFYNDNTLLHSGNIGDYKAGSANALTEEVLTDLNNATFGRIFTMTSGYDSTDGNKPTTNWVTGMTFRVAANDKYRSQLAIGGNSTIYFRRENNGVWDAWKTIAFTNSNVASATKATQDGNGNVITSTYLPKSGGTIKGTDTTPLIIVGGNSQVRLALGYGSSPLFAYLVYKGGFNWCVTSESYAGEKTLAFTDSNVASATKLKTARTIWGQSFDGSGDIDGYLSLENEIYIRTADTSGKYHSALYLSNANNLLLGYGTSAAGYTTKVQGNEVWLNYGKSHAVGFILNSSGNVTIGSSDLAGSDRKLYVDGSLRVNGATLLFDADKKNRVTITHESGIARIYNAGENTSIYLGSYQGNALNIVNDRVLIGTTEGLGEKLYVKGSGAFVIETQNNITSSDQLDLAKTFTITAASGTSNYGLHAWINTSGCVNLQSSYAGFSANKGTYSIALNPLGGNVLIGTSTDAGYKLYVNGTARIVDAVTMSSTLSVAGATTINGALTAGATTINGNLIVKGDVASA